MTVNPKIRLESDSLLNPCIKYLLRTPQYNLRILEVVDTQVTKVTDTERIASIECYPWVRSSPAEG